MDLMSLLALRTPAYVIGDLMGMEPAMHSRLKRWADHITSGVTTLKPDEEDRKQLARNAVAELRRYFGELLDALRPWRRLLPGRIADGDGGPARPGGSAEPHRPAGARRRADNMAPPPHGT